jgi:hypothetical protein
VQILFRRSGKERKAAFGSRWLYVTRSHEFKRCKLKINGKQPLHEFRSFKNQGTLLVHPLQANHLICLLIR